jgi:hypothetical protein
MRLGPLSRLPLFRVLALAEVAMLAREHMGKLSPDERHRLIALVRTAHGRPGNLRPREREELHELVGKLEPGGFARTAARKAVGMRTGRKR